MIVEMLAGFLFLLILALNLAMGALGYLMEKDEYDPDADLQKVHRNPARFQISIVLALIEHGCVIGLAVLLFIAFSPYHVILGIVWVLFRGAEGFLQFSNEPSYWSLLTLAERYSGSNDAEQLSLSDLTRAIFKTKDTRFKLAMICWSIGTLAYSIVLVTFEAAPIVIGWLGIVASILVGFSTGLKLIEPNSKDFTVIGGLSAILFEILIGGWLLVSPLI